MTEERRKDYLEMSDLKVSLAVAIAELRSTNENLKRIDTEQQEHAKSIADLREKTSINSFKLHAGWVAATLFASCFGFAAKSAGYVSGIIK